MIATAKPAFPFRDHRTVAEVWAHSRALTRFAMTRLTKDGVVWCGLDLGAPGVDVIHSNPPVTASATPSDAMTVEAGTTIAHCDRGAGSQRSAQA